MKKLVSTALLTGAIFAEQCQPMVHQNSVPQAQNPQAYSTLAFPKADGWHLSFGLRLGAAAYTIRANVHQSTEAIDTVRSDMSAFSLGFDQTMGFGQWFYIQLREYLSYGFVGEFTSGETTDYVRRPRRPYFFDADATIYIPFVVSRCNRITLQPAVGFSVNQVYIKGSSLATRMASLNLYKATYYSPLAGLALGYMPTDHFSMRLGMGVLLPNIDRYAYYGGEETPYSERRMHSRRLGMRASIDLRMQVAENCDLAGEISYVSMNGYRPDSTNFLSAYYQKTSALFGASWRF